MGFFFFGVLGLVYTERQLFTRWTLKVSEFTLTKDAECIQDLVAALSCLALRNFTEVCTHTTCGLLHVIPHRTTNTASHASLMGDCCMLWTAVFWLYIWRCFALMETQCFNYKNTFYYCDPQQASDQGSIRAWCWGLKRWPSACWVSPDELRYFLSTLFSFYFIKGWSCPDWPWAHGISKDSLNSHPSALASHVDDMRGMLVLGPAPHRPPSMFQHVVWQDHPALVSSVWHSR